MSEIEKKEAREGSLIVIGSSAGGIEAASILVSTLPTDFPAPLVLAQHLDPTRTSSLHLILRQRSILPVELVTARTHLEPGKVYVVPSNRQVSIQDSYVEVQEEALPRSRPRPSVDLLFASAAKAYGDCLIAVILTGSGSDGAAGAVEVKNSGGTVIVQNPQTARYPSMPLALPPSIVDAEVELEQIGPLLYDLLMGVSLPQAEEKTDQVLRQILEQVSQQASLDFYPYKTSTILRRIGRRMAVTHNRTMREYSEYLKLHPEEVGELVKAFLINVTHFFRDSEAFSTLQAEVLPRVIAQARERGRVLRIWAAGCSTGEEPYSLAMLLIDLLGAELPEWNVKVFATDLSETAITFARRGLYSENVLVGVPPTYRDRFFERVDHGYRVAKPLRQMVIFGQQDLTRNAPFPRIDLLLCRNVLIYFTPELQDYVLTQFAFSLTPGGYLFLGKAETVRPSQTYFELVNKRWKLYRCVNNAVLSGHSLRPVERCLSRSENRLNQAVSVAVSKQQTPEQDPPSPGLDMGQLKRLNELLLRFLPTGVVVIDRTYRVLMANGTARRLLGLRESGGELDFLHAVRGIPYTQVRNAIDAAFRERNSITLPEVTFDATVGGNGHSVSMSIALMQQEAGSSELVVMSVMDVTEQLQVKRRLEAAQAEQAQLLQELSAANAGLNQVNKELLDANEEFQVSNEELVLAQEELQSTIEEFETTNEELQATNEELETGNEELQSTSEELETTNDELRARTSELQELNHVLESERMRLSEMVELAPFSILILRGPRLLVEAYTLDSAPQVDLKMVQDRPLEEVFEYFWQDGAVLVGLAHETYEQNKKRAISRPVTNVSNEGVATAQHVVYTFVPSHDATGRVSGVMIYTVDETERLIKEADEERARLRVIFEHANSAAMALFDAQTAALILGSPRYLETVARVKGKERSNLPGELWYDLAVIAPDEDAKEIWKTVLESGTPLRRPEVHLKLTRDEPETVWDWTLSPIFQQDKPDAVRYMLVSAVEITEQIWIRQQVEQLHLLKNDVLSLASQELRPSLASIQENAEQIRQDLQRRRSASDHREISRSSEAVVDADRNVRAAESIIHQTEQVNRLIREMIGITRIRGDRFDIQNRESVDLVALLRHVIASFGARSRPAIQLETVVESLAGKWDAVRIELVLRSLLDNALKNSPADSTVEVGLEPRPNEAVIWVQDHGQGMNKEEQSQIFERFYQASGENGKAEAGRVNEEGLGLYIAREIIAQYNGRLWMETNPGEGNIFYISLPLEQARAR